MASVNAADFQIWCYNYFTDEVGLEFKSQISEWATHINTLIGCTKDAYDNQKTFLEAAKAKQQAHTDAILYVLTLVSGPALSFLSGSLQYSLFEKLFPKSKPRPVASKQPPAVPAAPTTPVTLKSTRGVPEKEIMERLREGRPENVKARGYKEQQDQLKNSKGVVELPTPKPLAPRDSPLAGSKVGAKVFGDTLGGQVPSLLISAVFRPAEPTAQAGVLQNAIAALEASTSLNMFEANMKNLVEAANSFGSALIQAHARGIRDDPQWGKNFVSTRGIAFAYASYTEEEQLLALQRVFKDAVDEQRKAWARQPGWFFYGNNPVRVSEGLAKNAIEAELWAIWIETENFQLHFLNIHDHEMVTYMERHYAKGKSGLDMDRIVPRLVKLGVLKASAQEEMRRRQQPATRKDADLLPAEVHDVEGDVDTEQEFASIKKWANERQPQILGGSLGGSKRRQIDPLVLHH